jgi:hypothetical protein
MADAKEEQFYLEVLNKTMVGRIRWEKTAEEQTYIASMGGKFTLSITESPFTNLYGVEAVENILTLTDSDGRVLTRVSTRDSNVEKPALRELYEAARRQALKVDEKLDLVLEQLRKL